MNRLFIIGNGFDLAHGLKTSYRDFLLWYLKSCFEKLKFEKDYEDDLISVKRKRQYENHNMDRALNLNAFEDIPDLLNIFYEGDTIWDLKIPSPFIKMVFNNSNSNWVNIENTYYRFLKMILKKNESSDNYRALKNLNNDLDSLRKKFIDYLKETCEGYNFNIDQSPFNRILSKINPYEKDIADVEDGVTDVKKESSTMFVNFNYTTLVEKYFDKLYTREGKFSLIQIHGSIRKPESIVFGFGDEIDDVYHEMERKNNNEFFKHIKSFKYFQDENYQKLMAFIDGSEPFEVIVLGHSLGLSDRTMLSQIFEHDNLERVQIYYYENENGNDFTEKTNEISRHFSNKGRMRLKVVPFSKSERIPQIEVD
ncbi:MAG: AbiH family protein [Brumimicrobium sp.]